MYTRNVDSSTNLRFSKVLLPAFNISGFITLEGILIINCFSCAKTFLWLNPISTYVKLLTVIWMGKGGVREFSPIGSHHISNRARESVFQSICSYTRIFFCIEILNNIMYIPLLASVQSFLWLSAGQAQVLAVSSYISPGGHGSSKGVPLTQLKNLSQARGSEWR